MCIDKSELSAIGRYNEKLEAAEDYELLVRSSVLGSNCVSAVFTDEDYKAPSVKTADTYAYVLTSYMPYLEKVGVFEEALNSVFSYFMEYGLNNVFSADVERYLSDPDSRTEVSAGSECMLVLTGEKVCGDVMEAFAAEFTKALRDTGEPVFLADLGDKEGGLRDEFMELITCRKYKAVVGFQTSYMHELGDKLKGSKYMFEFDHPVYYMYYLLDRLTDYNILSLDQDYTDFIASSFPGVKRAYTFPPAGSISQKDDNGDKVYDISFVGKYVDYRNALSELDKFPDDEKELGFRLFEYMKSNPEERIEKAFDRVLGERLYGLSTDDYLVLFNHVRAAGTAVKFYYREQIVKTIIDAGITLHVFSGSWNGSPYAGNDKLVIHNDVSYEDGLQIMAQSIISLNIMSWHKSCITERIINTMLNRSVCLTDETRYMKEELTDGENVLFFRLTDIDRLPKIIRDALSDRSRVEKIVSNAYRYASEKHTWARRAGEFLTILDGEQKLLPSDAYRTLAFSLDNGRFLRGVYGCREIEEKINRYKFLIMDCDFDREKENAVKAIQSDIAAGRISCEAIKDIISRYSVNGDELIREIGGLYQ